MRGCATHEPGFGTGPRRLSEDARPAGIMTNGPVIPGDPGPSGGKIRNVEAACVYREVE
jgi:hypothetical protein